MPVVSAITDLASLWGWAEPDIDLHLLTHPESAPEVRRIAPRSRVIAVRGLTDPAFYEPLDPTEARRALGLDPGRPLVTVSGGGWAVGDLEGGAEIARCRDADVVVACGRSEPVRAAVQARFADDPRVQAWGFTERMGELLAASDVLVHSTAGLTVLEALMRGTRVISYGWGVAHIRLNNVAYERFGLARVAASPRALDVALGLALAEPRVPDTRYERMPGAADEVLALVRR